MNLASKRLAVALSLCCGLSLGLVGCGGTSDADADGGNDAIEQVADGGDATGGAAASTTDELEAGAEDDYLVIDDSGDDAYGTWEERSSYIVISDDENYDVCVAAARVSLDGTMLSIPGLISNYYENDDLTFEVQSVMLEGDELPGSVGKVYEVGANKDYDIHNFVQIPLGGVDPENYVDMAIYVTLKLSSPTNDSIDDLLELQFACPGVGEDVSSE